MRNPAEHDFSQGNAGPEFSSGRSAYTILGLYDDQIRDIGGPHEYLRAVYKHSGRIKRMLEFPALSFVEGLQSQMLILRYRLFL